MEEKNKFLYVLVGFLSGVLLTAAVCLFLVKPFDNSEIIGTETVQLSQAGTTAYSVEQYPEITVPETAALQTEDTMPALSAEGSIYSDAAPETGTWDSTSVYNGGDTVSYQGKKYKAKWWTQGETPGSSDVWEDMKISDGEPTVPAGVSNIPIFTSEPRDTKAEDFKVVGYYPSWEPDKLYKVDFSVLTHVCYAFAIPTPEGGLRDLDNPETAEILISTAHENGAKVLLSVGGWSYNDNPLESVFMDATADSERVSKFVESIMAMCDKYGFDGVDMDWEHPRTDGTSARQYEELMLSLSKELRSREKLLTAAVLSGMTADGNVYYDAAAQTDAVLNAVDFINIMAYDGGDGDRHSQYDFAVNCGNYWTLTRGLPGYKAVLGVPFYSRPGWADYSTVLEAVPDAWSRDNVSYNGMEVYYNGVDTIKKKTEYALENLGGVMIWEVSQDSTDPDKSLIQTIGAAISGQ